MANLVAERINHLNYPDNQNRVYCRAVNEILSLAETKCCGCPLWYGTIQGMGTECCYVNLVSVNNDALALPVADPKKQYALINKLMDGGLIPVDPFCEAGAKDPLIEQYANTDDDSESPLGAAIFASKFGMSVEEMLDESEDTDNQ